MTDSLVQIRNVSHDFGALRMLDDVSLGIGHVHLGPGRVRDIVFQGSFRRVIVALHSDPAISLTARAPLGQALAVGERVVVSCLPSDMILLKE